MSDPDRTDSRTWSEWLDAESWMRWLAGGADAGWGPWLADATGWRPQLELPTIDDPDAFAGQRRLDSLDDGAWPQAVEKLVRHTPGKSEWAFTFLHGFGATRGGGEVVLDALADERDANVWYPLLPGHGRTPEAHAAATADEYLACAAESLAMARSLGKRVCLVGSSTGGLLCTWLAAAFPQHVDAVILASPFYAFADPNGLLFRLPFGLDAVEWAYGTERDASFQDPRRIEGYDEHWLTEQRTRAIAHLERLRGWLARDDVYNRVAAPVLLLYHPDDNTVSVDAMHYAFGRFQPNPVSRFVPIVDGNHVLMSAYVRTDKASVNLAIRAFLSDVQSR